MYAPSRSAASGRRSRLREDRRPRDRFTSKDVTWKSCVENAASIMRAQGRPPHGPSGAAISGLGRNNGRKKPASGSVSIAPMSSSTHAGRPRRRSSSSRRCAARLEPRAASTCRKTQAGLGHVEFREVTDMPLDRSVNTRFARARAVVCVDAASVQSVQNVRERQESQADLRTEARPVASRSSRQLRRSQDNRSATRNSGAHLVRIYLHGREAQPGPTWRLRPDYGGTWNLEFRRASGEPSSSRAECDHRTVAGR